MSSPDKTAAARLKSFIERIERLEAEKADLVADIREVYAEAKGTGFDVKTMRELIRLRKMEHADRQEQEALLELYKSALGMLDGTPLGAAAVERELAKTKKGKGAKAALRDTIEDIVPKDGSVTITTKDGGVKLDPTRDGDIVARQTDSAGRVVSPAPVAV